MTMTRLISRRVFLSIVAALAMFLPTLSLADDYPSKDITYVIPYAPGGMSDNAARIIGDKISQITGKKVINDYRPGAGGAIAANHYIGTKPDGYTIMQTMNSFYSTLPLMTKVEYDPKTDITPVAFIGDSPMVIAVSPSVPAKTLQELINYAKANPGKISYGTAGRGSVGHLCGEWLARKAGIELLHIPYNGTPQAMQASLSNEVQLVFGPESAELILSGKMNGLGVMGSQRWGKLPDLPSTVEAGIPGWAPRSWIGVSVLAKAPENVKTTLNKMINDILQMPDVKKRLSDIGLILSVEDIATTKKRADDDYAEYSKLFAEAGLGIGK
jgi:tripartite-type tricarboxylate transporter receptor subunit TctC